ncbi:MAG: hypothetical protein JNK51_01245 [Blastocatellia bacterium]|nr:hypothetical protein [Chloracidobacterium sp.]MBL8183521.1 hypothetical protein [Blastocatellia bacterium]HBE82216.1 hypothetical protein [Blastocatellia bacterium]HRJ90121.1 hypothetical protein [Pyrinomonadaceae bacterium]HRK49112.1 hypothetical protein [Pyrinomonadaceae bacterium]
MEVTDLEILENADFVWIANINFGDVRVPLPDLSSAVDALRNGNEFGVLRITATVRPDFNPLTVTIPHNTTFLVDDWSEYVLTRFSDRLAEARESVAS